MDFSYNEEQRLLGETVERFLDAEYSLELRREIAAGVQGFSSKVWSKFARLGLLGISVAEEYGGIDGSAVETTLVMDAIGRSLALEPYLGTAVIGARLVALAGSEAQKQDWLPRLVEGELSFTLAHVERQARFDLANIETRARADGCGYLLDGEKSVVLNGATADKVIVLARSSGQTTDRSGLSLFVVDRDTPGLTVRPYPMVDGHSGAEIRLENVAVTSGQLLGELGGASDQFERVIDEATVAVCAEAVGIMETMQRMTVDFLKQRRQFGRSLSSFQVLQHRLVDMMIACELSRSLVCMAAVVVGSDDAAKRRRAVSAAKIQIGRAGRLVGQESIQLHGGMGMADEMAIGCYFKRLTVIATVFGDISHHKARFALPG